MEIRILEGDIILIKDFWTANKCQEYIAKTEDIGYKEALVNTGRGQRRMPGIRNNERVLLEDKHLADELWEELQHIAPQTVGLSKSMGLNELFRFYKYSTGQRFKKHRDGSYVRNEFEASYFTFMIYLNQDYQGGETAFEDLVISPETGDAIIFPHSVFHEGKEVVIGLKYVLRTDIMYRRQS
ncbi:MAG: 2OG-Fe(II) oxygenase [Bacteroidota bacterium]